MNLRRLYRHTCPHTGGHWFTCERKPWARLTLLAADYSPTAKPTKAERAQQRRLRRKCDEVPEPTPRMAIDDPERWDLKQQVLEAAGYRCQRCHRRHRLTVDHIVPRVIGGGNHLANLQCLCKRCNKQKGATIWAPEVQLSRAA